MNQSNQGRPRWAGRTGQPTLGVVMIVKNEAENLPELFATLRGVADEVVVLDTGSTDATADICREWGVTLRSEAWRDDFAWARNRAIEAATARYLLWLDGDDRLPEETQRELARLRDTVLPGAPVRAYELQVHNVDAHGRVREEFVQTRLFPRRPDVRFQNAIHEEVFSSLVRAGIARVPTRMVVLHTGYASPEVVRQKNERNRALILAELERSGPTLHLLYYLADSEAGLGRFAEAAEVVGRAMEVERAATARPRMLAELHLLRATLIDRGGDRPGAVADVQRAAELWPEWALPYRLLAQIRATEEDLDGAWEAVRRARAGHWAQGTLAFQSRPARAETERIAAHVLSRRGDRAEAVRVLFAALETDPLNLDARLDLGQLLLDAREYPAALAVLEPAGQDGGSVQRFVDIAAAIGLARALCGDFDGAGACLAPLLDLFAPQLAGAADVSPLQLAEAMLRGGYPAAAGNMLVLHQATLQPA